MLPRFTETDIIVIKVDILVVHVLSNDTPILLHTMVNHRGTSFNLFFEGASLLLDVFFVWVITISMLTWMPGIPCVPDGP